MNERLMSAFGLMALLGLAWLFSKHRAAVKPRTVVWGVGLQLLFALIILADDDIKSYSWVGMFLLVWLVSLYVMARFRASNAGIDRATGRGEMRLADPAELDSVEVASVTKERTGSLPGAPQSEPMAPGYMSGTDPGHMPGTDPAGTDPATSGPADWDRSVLVWGGLAALGVAGLVLLGRASSLVGLGAGLLVAVAIAFLAAMRFVEPDSRWRALPSALFVTFLALGVGRLWALEIHGQKAFQSLSAAVASFLALSSQGAEFLFGNLARPEFFFPGSETWPGFGFQFAFVVLPTIIFFSAFMAVLYHLGIVPVVVQAMGRFMHWSLGTSGSETMSCSANVFVGQTEAPFLIKPFLDDMTASELHAVMVGGFATIAGGVLAGYIGMGVDAGHLIAASVMSAPAALVIAKLLYPETEVSKTAGDVEIPKIRSADNVVEAAANGTTDGLALALNVAAMLVAFIALIAVLDVGLGAIDGAIDGRLLGGDLIPGKDEFRGFVPGSMATLFGFVLAPLAFLMGVPWAEAPAVGNLLGIKMTINEFVAYGELSKHIEAGDLSERSLTIATYALCGFANFSSIGIQIGGIGTLAPSRRALLARIAPRALCGGALASFTTATVAGMLL